MFNKKLTQHRKKETNYKSLTNVIGMVCALYWLFLSPSSVDAAMITVSGSTGLNNIAVRALVNGTAETLGTTDASGNYSFTLNVNTNDLILIHINNSTSSAYKRAAIIKSDALTKTGVNLNQYYLNLYNYTSNPITNNEIDTAVDGNTNIGVVQNGGGANVTINNQLRVSTGEYRPTGSVTVNGSSNIQGTLATSIGTIFNLESNTLRVRSLQPAANTTILSNATVILETQGTGGIATASPLNIGTLILRDTMNNSTPVQVVLTAGGRINIQNNLTIQSTDSTDYVHINGTGLARHVIAFTGSSTFTYIGANMLAQYTELQDNSTNISLPLNPAGFTENIVCSTLNWITTPGVCGPAAPGIPDMTALTDLGPSNTDNLTSDRTPDFYMTCVNGNTVFIYNGATQIGTAVCGAGNNITITSSLLPFGTLSITARQRTPGGVWSAYSAALSATIDGSHTITWDSTGSSGCTFTGFTYNGTPTTAGSVIVFPLTTTTYTVTCTNTSGSTSRSVTITVL